MLLLIIISTILLSLDDRLEYTVTNIIDSRLQIITHGVSNGICGIAESKATVTSAHNVKDLK